MGGVVDGVVRGRRGAARILAVASIAAGSALVLAPVAPVRAASLTVTTTADTIDAAGTCPGVTIASLPGPDGQTSLREAVCATNNEAGPDTITFSVNGTFMLTGAVNEDNGGTGDLDVKQSLSINGNGTANTIIDGGGLERIFDVFPSAASTFQLENLTVQGGDTRATSFKEGGALYLHNNVTTTLGGVVVRNNFSGANGAIENRGTLTISNSTISGNQTIPASGSVVGGGLHTAGTTTISNSTISGNSVRGEGGGIAVSVGAATTVSISGSTISGNSASVVGGGLGNGGGISTTGNQGTINITNSTISGNSADVSGGGVSFTPVSGALNLTHVTIAQNTADADNNGTGTGGGLSRVAGSVVLKNTLVAGNWNSTAATRDDIAGTVDGASVGNLVGDGTGSSGVTDGANGNQVGTGVAPIDPLLGALAANGGPTLTHALAFGSPAVDAGDDGACLGTDQRGTSRVGNCDVGAYEYVDGTPPDTTITATPSNPSPSTGASVTFSGTDVGTGVASYQCAIDGGGFSACTSPQSYVGLSDGPHTFQVRAVDGAGNVDPTPASYTWTVDTVGPDTAIDSSPSDPSLSTTASFTFSGTDDASGVVWYQCALDGSAFDTCTSPVTYTGLSEGPHTFQVRALDGALNIDTTPASYTWTIDPGAGPALGATKSVTGTFVAGGTVTYTIVVTNSGSFTQQDNPGDEMVDVLPDTLELLGASASSGVVSTDSATRTVAWNGSLVPAAAVTITITAMIADTAAGETISNRASVAFDADDDGTNESSALSEAPEVGGPTELEVAPPSTTTTTTTTTTTATTTPSTTTTIARQIPQTGSAHVQSWLTLALLLVGAGLALVGVRRRIH